MILHNHPSPGNRTRLGSPTDAHKTQPCKTTRRKRRDQTAPFYSWNTVYAHVSRFSATSSSTRVWRRHVRVDDDDEIARNATDEDRVPWKKPRPDARSTSRNPTTDESLGDSLGDSLGVPRIDSSRFFQRRFFQIFAKTDSSIKSPIRRFETKLKNDRSNTTYRSRVSVHASRMREG